jgi:hypothetical protein
MNWLFVYVKVKRNLGENQWVDICSTEEEIVKKTGNAAV